MFDRPRLRILPGGRRGAFALIGSRIRAPTCEDLVQRRFWATRPNEVRLTDITEHPSIEGKVYCCWVLDLFSRKFVG